MSFPAVFLSLHGDSVQASAGGHCDLDALWRAARERWGVDETACVLSCAKEQGLVDVGRDNLRLLLDGARAEGLSSLCLVVRDRPAQYQRPSEEAACASDDEDDWFNVEESVAAVEDDAEAQPQEPEQEQEQQPLAKLSLDSAQFSDSFSQQQPVRSDSLASLESQPHAAQQPASPEVPVEDVLPEQVQLQDAAQPEEEEAEARVDDRRLCNSCTFANAADAAKCEMCGAALPEVQEPSPTFWERFTGSLTMPRTEEEHKHDEDTSDTPQAPQGHPSEEVDELRRRAECSEADLESTRLRMAKVETELSNAQAAVEELQQTVDELQATKHALTDELEQRMDVAAEAEAGLMKAQKALCDSEARLVQLEAVAHQLEATVRALDEEGAAKTNRLRECEALLAEMEHKMEEMHASNDVMRAEAEEQAATHAAEVAALKQALAQALHVAEAQRQVQQQPKPQAEAQPVKQQQQVSDEQRLAKEAQEELRRMEAAKQTPQAVVRQRFYDVGEKHVAFFKTHEKVKKIGWRLRNTGGGSWPDSTQFMRVEGAEFGVARVEMPRVRTGHDVNITFNARVPDREGHFSSRWTLCYTNDAGDKVAFGPELELAFVATREELDVQQQQKLVSLMELCGDGSAALVFLRRNQWDVQVAAEKFLHSEQRA